jgi:sugar-specific transcriptional regulator TrmB
MSHCIDFSCHGLTQSWNGHWIFSEKQWRIVNGNKKVIVNRAPKSAHIKNKLKNGFEVLISKDVEKDSLFSQIHFHENYKDFTSEDANTFASFIVSQKKSEAIK